jgi:hypothetical protein
VLEKNKMNIGMVFDLWLGYQYPGMGGEHLKRTRAVQLPLPALQPLGASEQVRNWLAAGTPGDPNETIEETGEDMKQAAKFGISGSHPKSKPYPMLPIARVGNSLIIEKQDCPSRFVPETEQSFDNLPAREPLDSVNKNLLPIRPEAELKDDFLSIPANRRPIYRSPGMRDLRIENISRSENIRSSNVSQSLLDSDIEDDEQKKLSNIPVSQPLRAISSTSDKINVDDRRREFFSNPYNSQSLLDSDVSDTERLDLQSGGDGFWGQRTPNSALPTIQEETEANSRVYPCTINQRAPRPASRSDECKDKAAVLPSASVAFEDLSLKNSTKEFDDEMKANVKIILTSLRNYNGEITLECHFGRILIKPFAPSIMHSLEKAHSVPAEHMRDLLLSNPKKIGFTKSITTLSTDMYFILNMRIEETNQRIWSDIAEWKVKYEYICCDHEDYDGKCGPGFVIEMDADSLETKVKSAPVNFGNLNVHGTLRNWDYVISATGSKNLEEDYGDLVEAIKGSTYIA